MMIEPTETETKATLDAFCDAMLQIAQEAQTDPDMLRHAPHTLEVGRLDEANAAKCLEFVLDDAPGRRSVRNPGPAKRELAGASTY